MLRLGRTWYFSLRLVPVNTSEDYLRDDPYNVMWGDKLCSLSKCLHQAAPTYLADLCSSVSESASRGHLCSAAWGDLAVPRSRTTRHGQRCFAVSRPTLWNSLRLTIPEPSLTLTQFCALLKTVLFYRVYKTLA